MIASSSTMPTASAKSVTVLSDIPSASMIAKTPISETGIATMGTIVARMLPRKTKTTEITSTKAISSVSTAFVERTLYEGGGVEGHLVAHAVGKARLEPLQFGQYPLRHGKRVCARRLVDRHDGGIFPVVASGKAVDLRAQLHPCDIAPP